MSIVISIIQVVLSAATLALLVVIYKGMKKENDSE